MYFPRRCLAAALALLPAAGARAQPAALESNRIAGAAAVVAAPPVDTLVAWALHTAPRLDAQRHAAAAARARTRAAGAFADPRLEVSLEDVGFPRYTVGEEEMSALGFEVRQDLGAITGRGALRRLAGATAAEQDLAIAVLERETVRDVRVAYARLYALDARMQELESALEVVKQLREAATARFGTGSAPMEPQLRAQLAVARIDAELDEARADRAAGLADLERAVGRPAAAAWGVFAALPAAMPAPPAAAAAPAAMAPGVARAQAAVEAADRRVEVEIRGGRPRFEVAAGYANRGGFDDMVSLRLGTELPVWRRGKQGPLVAAARLEALAARADLRAAGLENAADARRWTAAWQRADVQLGRLRSTIVPQAASALDVARAAYGSGRGELATVLEDWEIWLRARQEVPQREAERFAAWAELEALAPQLRAAPVPEGTP